MSSEGVINLWLAFRGEMVRESRFLKAFTLLLLTLLVRVLGVLLGCKSDRLKCDKFKGRNRLKDKHEITECNKQNEITVL